MVVDGFTNLYILINAYASDAAWAVLFSLPALVLSYVLGLIALAASDLFLVWIGRRAPAQELDTFLQVAATGNQAVVERYLALVQHQTLLDGGLIGFSSMAIGTLFSMRWLGGFEAFGWIAFAGFGMLAAACPALGGVFGRRAQLLAEHTQKLPMKGKA
jgi:hypothetical protein